MKSTNIIPALYSHRSVFIPSVGSAVCTVCTVCSGVEVVWMDSGSTKDSDTRDQGPDPACCSISDVCHNNIFADRNSW